MRRYLQLSDIDRVWDYLAGLQSSWVPRMMVIVSGLLGVGTSLLFLTMAHRFTAAPTLAFLVNALPPLYWGMFFGFLGVVLLTCAWIEYTKALGPAVLFALLLFVFAVLSSLSFFDGPATGVAALFALALGVYQVAVALLCVAPRTAEALHQDQR